MAAFDVSLTDAAEVAEGEALPPDEAGAELEAEAAGAEVEAPETGVRVLVVVGRKPVPVPVHGSLWVSYTILHIKLVTVRTLIRLYLRSAAPPLCLSYCTPSSAFTVHAKHSLSNSHTRFARLVPSLHHFPLRLLVFIRKVWRPLANTRLALDDSLDHIGRAVFRNARVWISLAVFGDGEVHDGDTAVAACGGELREGDFDDAGSAARGVREAAGEQSVWWIYGDGRVG